MRKRNTLALRMGSGHQPRAHWTGLGAVPPEQPVGLTGLDPQVLSVGA